MFKGAQIPKAFAIPICLVEVNAQNPLTAQISPPIKGNQNADQLSWSKPMIAVAMIAKPKFASDT